MRTYPKQCPACDQWFDMLRCRSRILIRDPGGSAQVQGKRVAICPYDDCGAYVYSIQGDGGLTWVALGGKEKAPSAGEADEALTGVESDADPNSQHERKGMSDYW